MSNQIYHLEFKTPTYALYQTPGIERPVDRDLLVRLAPDREDIIRGSRNSIAKIRDAFAIKVSEEEYNSG